MCPLLIYATTAGYKSAEPGSDPYLAAAETPFVEDYACPKRG